MVGFFFILGKLSNANLVTIIHIDMKRYWKMRRFMQVRNSYTHSGFCIQQANLTVNKEHGRNKDKNDNLV